MLGDRPALPAEEHREIFLEMKPALGAECLKGLCMAYFHVRDIGNIVGCLRQSQALEMQKDTPSEYQLFFFEYLLGRLNETLTEEAEETLLRSRLLSSRREFGLDADQSFLAAESLVRVFLDKSDFVGALKLREETMPLYEKFLGPGHPSSRNNRRMLNDLQGPLDGM